MLKKSLFTIMVISTLFSFGCSSSHSVSRETLNNNSIESVENTQELNNKMCQMYYEDKIFLISISSYCKIVDNNIVNFPIEDYLNTLNDNCMTAMKIVDNKELPPKYKEMFETYLDIHSDMVLGLTNLQTFKPKKHIKEYDKFFNSYKELINYKDWLEDQ